MLGRMVDRVPEAVAVVVETAMVATQHEALAPLAAFASQVVARYLADRFDVGRREIRDEFARAGIGADHFRDDDQLAAAALRYSRAVRDQAADENLRILAQAMHGLAARQELWATDYLKFAEILAPLSRDELILIGRVMAEDRAWNVRPEPLDQRPTVWHMVTLDEFGGLFRSQAYGEAIAGRAVRSGLILGRSGFGSIVYELSELGREAREFVDIDAAVNPRGR